MRAIHHQFALVFAERTRVSREIHDTLLQSLGAIGMELETIAREVDSSQGAAIHSLRRLRRQVAHSVREARQWIWELRSDRMETRGLAEALRHWTADGSSGKIEHADIVEAAVRADTPPKSRNSCCGLVRKPITNASRHCWLAVRFTSRWNIGASRRASRVPTTGAASFRKTVSRPRGEHWGLVTIKERVARIGGRLDDCSSRTRARSSRRPCQYRRSVKTADE